MLRLRFLAWGPVVLTACTSAAPTDAEVSVFTPAVVVSSATANGATPMFTVRPDGARVLSWVSEPDEGSEAHATLHVRVDRADGVAPLTSELRDPLGGIEPHGEAPPQVATGPDGSIHALYTVGKDVGARFPLSALRYARSDDGGQSWSKPVSVNEGESFGSHNFHALLVGPDGAVYASWLSSVRGESGVWLRVSRDGGRSWQASRPIHTAPTCPCCRTALALGTDGTLYASWRKIYDGDVRDITVMASRDGGTTWDEPVKPRDDGWVFPGCPHAGPSLKVDAAGIVHIAWWTGKAGEAGVWHARSTDGGRTWTAQPIAVGERASPAHVQLALAPDDRVVVSWDDGTAALPGILLRTSSDGGATFAPTTRLSGVGVAGSFPVLAVHHDSLTVAWTQTADSAYRAMLAERPDMRDPAARMSLPRVGQQEVWLRTAPLEALAGP
jgi:hypothetical protein